MTTLEIKSNIFDIVSKMDDKSSLEVIYKLILDYFSQNNQQLNVWDKMSAEQKARVYAAYEESLDEDNLVDHEEVKLMFSL